MTPGPSFGGSRYLFPQEGQWLPLPQILSGYCVHPFHPQVVAQNGQPGPSSARSRLKNRFSWSGINAVEQDDAQVNPYEVALDIGDEFFAFEEYRARDGEGEVWYRGYVIQAVSIESLSSIPQSIPPKVFPQPEPSVLIGIFPAAVVRLRPGAFNDEAEPSEAYKKALRLAEDRARAATRPEIIREEDEEDSAPVVEIGQGSSGKRKSLPLHGLGISRPNRPKSLVLAPRQTEVDGSKEQPPLPTLTAGDSTLAGQQWPLIDEISCAIREWYGRLPTYLAQKEYRVFNLVVQHIDALFLGRRQLLSQTLSADELIRVRKECVSRLVKCNVAQGLEIIVRSLEDGSVMVLDKSRAVSESSYMTGITAYVYQVQLAYIDLIPLDTLFGQPHRPMATGKAVTGASHLLLDVRAFVASPCAPGETAELYFSLFSKLDRRFVSEEFCLTLNHLGAPARDAEQRLGRMKTLFTDLKADEFSSGLYLVCRLVRNGGIKMRTEASSVETHRRSNSVRPTGTYLSPDMNTVRSKVSLSAMTDDSWSITSGFAGHRTTTVETSLTTTASIIDGRPSYRRPLGCAVLELPGKLSGDGMEFSMPIFVRKEEELFATLHEDIINKSTELLSNPRAEAIVVSIKAMSGTTEQIINEHPSLSDIPLSARIGFSDAVIPGHTRHDLYIKLWSADFFPVANTGGSIRLRKTAVPANHGNVQITIDVRRADGTIIPDVIFAGGSGEPAVSQYHSMCFTNTEKPTYGEMLKISLPDVRDAHLFLVFRSRGKDRHLNPDILELERPFAFGYLPLIGVNDCVEDGLHQLVLYRSDSKSFPGPSAYLHAPATSAQATQEVRHIIPTRDRLSLRTYLASTLVSQNPTLRSLFAWQTEDLASVLQMFSFVSEEEIAKFIPSVLNSLFSIFVSDKDVKAHVFSALVKVLSMSTDRRFPHFDTALQVYLDEHFSHPALAFSLLSIIKSMPQDSKEYRNFLKVWHLFFRIIIRSRQVDRARGIGLDATAAHIEADFKRQVRSVLEDINGLMQSSEKGLIGTQTLAVQHYADLLPSLAQIFSSVDLAEMVIAFADTLTHVKGNVAVYKLLLLLQVVHLVFESADSRGLLVPALVRWVKPHLGKYVRESGGSEKEQDTRRIKWMECNRLALTVVARTVNSLQGWLESPLLTEENVAQERDNLEYCLTLLPSLCDSYAELRSSSSAATLARSKSEGAIWKETPDIFPMTHPFALISQLPPPSLLEQHHSEAGLPDVGTFHCGVAECAAVILSMIIATPRENIDRYLVEMLDIEGTDTTSSRLQGFFAFASSVIHFDAFPKEWLTLTLMTFSSIIKLLQSVVPLLYRTEFVPPINDAASFDQGLFQKAFELLCDLCGSQELALEDHTQQKRRAGWIIAGDLRDEGAHLLITLWEALGWSAGDQELRHGGYQIRFANLAERVLGLCLSSHDQLCESAVEILYSMIQAEYLLTGKFGQVETEIFTKLDGLFSSRAGGSEDGAMRAYFVTQLRNIFEGRPTPDPGFAEQFKIFLDEVELFIDLLLSLRDIPPSVAWKDERALATCRLMEFIKRTGRSELYFRFVHQLVQINLEAKDSLGAGMAMRTHAEGYEWVDGGDNVPIWEAEGIVLPEQTQFARRESLYYHAIDYFAEAEAYEFALELCQDLTLQHQNSTYNVEKLAELLTHQAKLWERIAQASRPKPEYFRIAFYGDCTPVNQGKEFIVRGQPWQRYSDFCESIQAKLPHATIHRSKIPPAIPEDDQPVIWITTVHPEPDASHPALRDGVHPNIQSYHRHNGVRQFTTVRPFLKEGQSAQAGISWTEKTILTTAEDLPGLLSRSEVVDVRYEEVSPVSTAITDILKATTSLKSMFKAGKGQVIDVKILGTALNGAVDSPVNGGVKVYKEAFLDPAYVQANPTEAEDVQRFRVIFEEYVKTVREGLHLHKRLCKDIAFHEALMSHFRRAFPEESISFSDHGSPPAQSSPARFGNNSQPNGGTPLLAVTPNSPLSHKTPASPAYIGSTLPPLRLAPAPSHQASATGSPILSVPGSGSPNAAAEHEGSIRSSASQPNGLSGLSSRARSIVGSISRSPSIPAGAGGGGGGGSGTSLNGHGGANGDDGGPVRRGSLSPSVSTAGQGRDSVVDVPVSEFGGNKGMLKRLSMVMRRGSAAS